MRAEERTVLTVQTAVWGMEGVEDVMEQMGVNLGEYARLLGAVTAGAQVTPVEEAAEPEEQGEMQPTCSLGRPEVTAAMGGEGALEGLVRIRTLVVLVEGEELVEWG